MACSCSADNGAENRSANHVTYGRRPVFPHSVWIHMPVIRLECARPFIGSPSWMPFAEITRMRIVGAGISIDLDMPCHRGVMATPGWVHFTIVVRKRPWAVFRIHVWDAKLDPGQRRPKVGTEIAPETYASNIRLPLRSYAERVRLNQPSILWPGSSLRTWSEQ
jgi:hypothetical protein